MSQGDGCFGKTIESLRLGRQKRQIMNTIQNSIPIMNIFIFLWVEHLSDKASVPLQLGDQLSWFAWVRVSSECETFLGKLSQLFTPPRHVGQLWGYYCVNTLTVSYSGWCRPVDGVLVCKLKVTSSIPSQGTCGLGPQLRVCEKQLIDVSLVHWCFSLSLSPSLPSLFIKRNKIFKKHADSIL